MPKYTHYQLRWSEQAQTYALSVGGQASEQALTREWLEQIASFSFHSRSGMHYTVRKQKVQRGNAYWYGYRRLHGRIVKRYLGRTADLSLARLEEIGNLFERESPLIQPRLDRQRETTHVQPVPRLSYSGPTWQSLTVAARPLLLSKLSPPRVSAFLLDRSRLFPLLDAGRACPLTLLAAPAGFGKTTLVCQWMAARRAHFDFPSIAWVALDAEDNDPTRFWHYIMIACQHLQGEIASSHKESAAVSEFGTHFPLDGYQARAQFPFASFFSTEATLTNLLNTFTGVSEGILVLEDYHVIVEAEIHQGVAFLLDHLPASLHVFLITRSDPPFSLAKLRASGNLCEVRASDLRFSLQEIQQFLQPMTPFPLSEEVVGHLHRRLNGWAVGLRLLSLSLQEQSSAHDAQQVLTAFTGSHRPLQEYFVSEVLARQPADVQDFLLHTTLPERLTTSLCQTLTGREDSFQVLEHLEQSGLFLEALGEQRAWYRYHALFREAIGIEARRRLGEETLQLLAHHASQWFEQHDMLSQAIEMAFHSKDMTYTVGLIEHFLDISRYKELHEYHTLFRWLKQLPVATLKQSPALCLSYATTLLFAATADRLEPHTVIWIQELLHTAMVGFEQDANQPMLGEILPLRALLSWRQDLLPQAANDARQALTFLPRDEVFWRGIADYILGSEAFLLGQWHLARKTFQQTRALGQRFFSSSTTPLSSWIWGKGLFTLHATVQLARTCFQQGELHLAAEYYQQVVRETEGATHLDRAHALLGAARIAYEWNDLDGADQQAQEAALIGAYLTDEASQARASLLQARVLQARGETTSAIKLLVELQARQLHLLPQIEREIVLEQARLHLALGDVAAALRWAAEYVYPLAENLPLAQYVQEALFLARLSLAQGQIQEVLTDLQHLLDSLPEQEHSRIGLEIQLLLAQAEAETQQGVEARNRLLALLALTQREGYQRLYLDEGEAIGRLLRSVAPLLRGTRLKSYLQQLLQAPGIVQPDLSATPLLEPLSPQELRVLRELASGSSAPQIAQHLIVSVTTVRTQIQSIYRKLQVHNRVAAIEAARTLHLL